MTRALVLGGGGPVGIAWESGLAVGLGGLGVDLAAADRIIGTSAGSVVGAELALGLDLEAAARALAATRRPATEIGTAPGPDLAPTAASDGGTMADRMQRLMEAMAAAAASDGPPEAARAEIGRLSLETPGLAESTFVAFFDQVKGFAWPDRFACTSVDATTGEFVVWDAASGIDLQLGVASSCSVPCVYPAVTIDGRRYIDGGMRSGLNADVACGSDVVLVVSVMMLELPEGVSNPMFDRMRASVTAEFEAVVAAGGELAVIEPGAEFLDVSGFGTRLMDASVAVEAFEAGRRQGAAEAERLGAIWSA